MTQTNYNERLEEVLEDFKVWCTCGSRECQAAVNYKQSKSALTQLFKDLVAEAKPELVDSDFTMLTEDMAHNDAIRLFEQNLLKLLENK